MKSTNLKIFNSDSLYPNNSVSFSDAKEFCAGKGMILPVPKSPEENYLIWMEKEKTSDINLELIWLGTGLIFPKMLNMAAKTTSYRP